MGRTVLAVDFGSSNTAAAFRDASGHSTRIKLSAEGYLMPSAVFRNDDTIVVGRTAVQAAITDPAAFEISPKRRIGDGSILLGADEIGVSRLISAVLAEVFALSRRAMGVVADEVVLTHPDTWAGPRQQRLVDAAVAAGVARERIRLVSEATSAAWYYTVAASQLPVGSRLAVFDFGAGTCDVAVLDKRQDSTFEVVAADGIEGFGGQDLDARIFAWVRRQLADSDPALGESVANEPASRLTLTDRIREAKEALSEAASAPIVVSGSAGGAVLALTRDEFEGLVGRDIDRAVALTRDVLADAEGRRPATSPVTIYLTGGSSAIPLVQARLSALGTVAALGDPKTVVAQGALLAPRQSPGAIEDEEGDTVVTDSKSVVEEVTARTRAVIPQLRNPPAGWYRDPRNPRDQRHWNGTGWTPADTKSGLPRAEPSAPVARRQPPEPGSVIDQRDQPKLPPMVPAARTEPRVPLTGSTPAPTPPPPVPTPPVDLAGGPSPSPFASTQVAPLPIFPRSNPALAQTPAPPAPTPKAEPEPPEIPGGRAGLTDTLGGPLQALVSALLLIPTAGLLLGFEKAGSASDFTILWQWQLPSTAWFVTPYAYLVAAILVFGRTPRTRRLGALIALGAMVFHMAGSAALEALGSGEPARRAVYGVAGVIAVCAWAVARRRHRAWLVGLVVAAPAMLAIRYVDQMVTVAGLDWVAAWNQYFGSFAIGCVVLWTAELLAAPQTAKPR